MDLTPALPPELERLLARFAGESWRERKQAVKDLQAALERVPPAPEVLEALLERLLDGLTAESVPARSTCHEMLVHLGGSGQISGNFTLQQANDLAILLRAGALPAPLTVIEERTVGPGLGQDSIEKGELAAYVGSIMVELAASWAIVMVLTGLYLWWPRSAKGLGGVLYPRIGQGAKRFWRDLHAVVGIWVSVFALFLLITGMPWALVWGNGFKTVRNWTGTAPGR